MTVVFVHGSHSGSADVANWELSCFSNAAAKRRPACRAGVQTKEVKKSADRGRREKANWLIMELIAVKFISV